MRGHEPLIAMRCQGKRPPYVIVTCGTDKTRGWRWWWDLNEPAEVEIEPSDAIPHLDLRWSHGLVLAVIGDDERVIDFMLAVDRCKPKTVYGYVNNEVMEMTCEA